MATVAKNDTLTKTDILDALAKQTKAINAQTKAINAQTKAIDHFTKTTLVCSGKVICLPDVAIDDPLWFDKPIDPSLHGGSTVKAIELLQAGYKYMQRAVDYQAREQRKAKTNIEATVDLNMRFIKEIDELRHEVAALRRASDRHNSDIIKITRRIF